MVHQYRLKIAPLLALMVLFVANAASAAEGKVWVGANVANLNDLGTGGLWGPGVAVGGQLQLDDFWSIVLDANSSYHFENVNEELPADWVNALGLSLRYNLDVFTYVPWFGLGATFYLDAPMVADAALETNLGAKLAFGVDWRYDRGNSLGFYGEIHALATDLERYPIYSVVGMTWNWHSRF